MNDELLAMLLDILIAQQTAGHQGMGGDIPYDDYSLQDTIGGLGAVDGNAYPAGSSSPGLIDGITNVPSFYDTSPSTVGYSTAGAQAEQQRALNAILMAMQQGVGAGATPMYGLFGSPGPEIVRTSQPGPPQVTPVAAPVAGSVSRTTAKPTPNPSSDVSTLPERDKPKGTPTPKGKTMTSRAPQAARDIATAAQGRRAAVAQPMPANPAPRKPASGNTPRPSNAPNYTFMGFQGNPVTNVKRSIAPASTARNAVGKFSR